MAIIPPTMTQGSEVFASYMGPYREGQGTGHYRFVITVNTAPPNIQMIAHAEIIVATRDCGIALADAIRMVVLKEVPPPIVQTDFTREN